MISGNNLSLCAQGLGSVQALQASEPVDNLVGDARVPLVRDGHLLLGKGVALGGGWVCELAVGIRASLLVFFRVGGGRRQRRAGLGRSAAALVARTIVVVVVVVSVVIHYYLVVHHVVLPQVHRFAVDVNNRLPEQAARFPDVGGLDLVVAVEPCKRF